MSQAVGTQPDFSAALFQPGCGEIACLANATARFDQYGGHPIRNQNNVDRCALLQPNCLAARKEALETFRVMMGHRDGD